MMLVFARQVVYSQFRSMVDGGQVQTARFDSGAERVYFELRSDVIRNAMTEQGKLATWPEGAPFIIHSMHA